MLTMFAILSSMRLVAASCATVNIKRLPVRIANSFAATATSSLAATFVTFLIRCNRRWLLVDGSRRRLLRRPLPS